MLYGRCVGGWIGFSGIGWGGGGGRIVDVGGWYIGYNGCCDGGVGGGGGVEKGVG